MNRNAVDYRNWARPFAGQAQAADEEQKDTQLDRAVQYLKDSFLSKKMGA